MALRAIEADANIGLLLPCNVVVREEIDSSITVAFIDPEALFQMIDSPDIQELAKEVKGLLQRVSSSLGSED